MIMGDRDMTDINYKLLQMIISDFSNDKICDELHITKKELKHRINTIKSEGFNITKNYNYNGTRSYIFNKDVLDDDDIISIDGEIKGKGFRALAIADTHIGNGKDNMKYVDAIYNYCIEKNIHIVFHAGDLFDGDIPYSLQPKEQFEKFLALYPCENDILTFLVFGNHEESFLTKYGINLKTVIEKYRDDIVPLGYGERLVRLSNIKDDIVMCHNPRGIQTHGVVISGHSHRYKFVADDYHPQIIVPTLSDYLHTCDYPGAVELYIESYNKVRYLMLKHLVIDENEKIRVVSKVEHKSSKNYVRK